MVAQYLQSALTRPAEGEASFDLPVPLLQPREFCLSIHREEVWRWQPCVQGVRPDLPDKHKLYVADMFPTQSLDKNLHAHWTSLAFVALDYAQLCLKLATDSKFQMLTTQQISRRPSMSTQTGSMPAMR